MLGKWKRNLLRRQLKKENRRLLLEMKEVERKLKILDDLDKKEKDK